MKKLIILSIIFLISLQSCKPSSANYAYPDELADTSYMDSIQVIPIQAHLIIK